MAEFKVSFEINIEAKNPINAAEKVEKWLHKKNGWQYYVQNEKTGDIFLVDLGMVFPIHDYKPFITPQK
jgi:hypothetical protein